MSVQAGVLSILSISPQLAWESLNLIFCFPCCLGFGRTETMRYGLLDYTATLGIVSPPVFWCRIPYCRIF